MTLEEHIFILKQKVNNPPIKELVDLLMELHDLRERARWIAVSERLPELDAMILILTRHRTVEVSWLKKDNWWYFRNSAQPFNFATHWMPLPEPPEGAQDNV
jgi:hypothetical protein